MRAGIGYDVHRLVQGRKLVLGGVEIPFARGLAGYSDGDALVHAIIDALLGAIGAKDIGTHFPTGDPQYKDISSIILLSRIEELLSSQKWQVENIDATIVAERPKLAPFIDQMREQIGHALKIGVDRISIKAKTADGLGFCGREEGIAALAVALVEKESR